MNYIGNLGMYFLFMPHVSLIYLLFSLQIRCLGSNILTSFLQRFSSSYATHYLRPPNHFKKKTKSCDKK